MSVLAGYAAAWLAGDLERIVAHYADDIVLQYGGTSEFAGEHAGRQRAIEVLVETAVRSHRRLLSVDLVLEHGDSGALFVRESLVVDGSEVEVERALRFRLRDGLIAECRVYDHDQHLVDRAWGAPGAVVA